MTSSVTNVQKSLLIRLSTWERLVEMRTQSKRSMAHLLEEAVYDLYVKVALAP